MIEHFPRFKLAQQGFTLLVLLGLACARGTSFATCNPSAVLSPATIIAGGRGAAIVSADFDGDGRADLASAGYGGVLVRLNYPASLTAYAAGVDPFGLVAGDFNRDGIVDLATANVHGDNVSILIGQGVARVGNGTFLNTATLPAGSNPFAIATGDFDGDGNLDLVASNQSGASVAVYLGHGDGSFGPARFFATDSAPLGIAVGDFNGDGTVDIAVASHNVGTVSLLRGLGDGTFRARITFPVGVNPIEVAKADLNGDGRLDLVVSNQGPLNTVSVLMGSSTGSFDPQVTYTVGGLGPRGLAIADFNGDGALDVAVSNQLFTYGAVVSLLFGRGGGLFTVPTKDILVAGNPAGAVATDLNGDGASDLAVVSLDLDNLSIMMNFCAPQPPAVFSFFPTGGAAGDAVTIQGQGFNAISAVRFNGVPSPFVRVGPNTIRTSVPTGASTGPISVTAPLGTGTSSSSFNVGQRPIIDNVSPDSGSVGETVALHGRHFLGTTQVSFGGAGKAQFTVVSDSEVTAAIDSLAVTGPIKVAVPAVTGTSSFTFRIVPINPTPRIVAIRDVPDDQGRLLAITWKHSGLDNSYVSAITSYRVWRRPIGAYMVEGRSGMPTTTWRSSASLGLAVPGYWELIATLPAAFLDAYTYTASTTQDSSADGNPHTAFFVQALTADPVVFYGSPVDSGYSVDNLAPAQPGPFAAVYGPSSVALHWWASHESDLREYQLYRGPSPDFIPSPGNLVMAGRDTGYVDRAASPSYAYKLSAVDMHGNESPFALVTPGGSTGVPALALTLSGMQPNPALRDRLRVAFSLPDGSPGVLALIDVSGRRVREREIGSLGPGNHVMDLGGERLSPGMYLLELRQGGRRVTAKAAIR